MLGLDDTAMLLDALRPPAGMQISAAVGTTFTLDLAALLTIPLAATLNANANANANATEGADLLETISRYADRTVLFCQAGAISVPAQYRAAHTFIEQTVIEIKKPASGIFHPKFWAVRFEGGGTTVHRVLVMSRNLTFDRAWDVIVRLDEDPRCEHALDVGDLLELLVALPLLAARNPSQPQQDLIDHLVSTLGQVRLAVPAPFTAGTTVSQMSSQHLVPFHPRCDKALAVSPFLSAAAAKQFVATADRTAAIVSRRASLDGAAPGLRDPKTIVLRVKDAVLDAQESADLVLDDSTTGPDEADEPAQASPAMRGLHAKFYVQDLHGESTVWLGSANLTTAAFRSNVEIQLALTGPTREVGVDAFLDPKRERRDLSRLVEDHDLAEADLPPEVDDGVTVLEGLAYELASRKIIVALGTVPMDDEQFTAEISIEGWSAPPGLDLRARLLSLPDYHFVTDGIASVPAFRLTAITPFVVLELSQEQTIRRVLVRADLENDPGGRRSAVLAHAIATRDDFLRYLAALLGFPMGGFRAAGDAGIAFGAWGDSTRSDRILEDLLSTASRSPQRLAGFDQTLKHLDERPETRKVVPSDFRQIWQAVHAACKEAIQ